MKYKGLIPAALCALLAVGCASTSMSQLSGGGRVNGAESVVFLRLRIADPERMAASAANREAPFLDIKELDMGDYGSAVNIEPRPVPETGGVARGRTGWSEQGPYHFDGLAAFSARAGRFYLRRIVFYGRYGRMRIAIPVHRVFTVPAAALCYLGAFTVTIKEQRGTQFQYRLDIAAAPEEGGRDSAVLQAVFPAALEAFHNKIDIRPLWYRYRLDLRSMTEDVTVSLENDSAVIGLRDEGGERYYAVESRLEGDNYYFTTCRKSFTGTRPFSVTWDSLWKKGAADMSYGLFLGADAGNAYFFATTARGSSAVADVKGDTWQKRPADWRADTANAGDGATLNRHRVDVLGKKIVYSVNGKKAAEFENTRDFSRYTLGFFASGKQLVYFKNILVEEITEEMIGPDQ